MNPINILYYIVRNLFIGSAVMLFVKCLYDGYDIMPGWIFWTSLTMTTFVIGTVFMSALSNEVKQ